MIARLGLCSSYSLLYGVRRSRELIDKVKVLGTDVVCIADRDNLYGLPAYLEKAKEAGLRPVIGVCLTIENHGTVYCFVQSREGYSRLCEILTVRNRDKKNYNPLALLRENSSGLILASADTQVLEALAGRVKRLYGAITPDTIGAAGITRRLHIPLAFLDTSLFLEQEDYKTHRVLRAIGLNKTVGSLKPEDIAAEGSHVLQDSEALHRRL
ncbi:MAG: PHP domain-containing protein, partial [Treponema sp.]|nr:PHP domain-containing protein [Treponema sp.]